MPVDPASDLAAQDIRELVGGREPPVADGCGGEGSGTGWVGGGAGSWAVEQCDDILVVPGPQTGRMQEGHIARGHAVIERLADRLGARPLA